MRAGMARAREGGRNVRRSPSPGGRSRAAAVLRCSDFGGFPAACTLARCDGSGSRQRGGVVGGEQGAQEGEDRGQEPGQRIGGGREGLGRYICFHTKFVC